MRTEGYRLNNKQSKFFKLDKFTKIFLRATVCGESKGNCLFYCSEDRKSGSFAYSDAQSMFLLPGVRHVFLKTSEEFLGTESICFFKNP